MTLTSDVVFRDGLDFFGATVDRLPPESWDAPSPCEGWTARDVLGHVGQAVDFGTHLRRGEQPAWAPAARPADAVHGEPAAYWQSLVDDARQAVGGVDLDAVVDSPRGPRRIADGLAFPAVDLFVHAWDLARTAGLDVAIPDEVIDFAHSYFDPIPTEAMRGGNGVFGPEIDAPADATTSERFLAFTGRRPR